MNSIGVANVAVMGLAIGALTKAVELLTAADYIGAGVAAVIGLCSLYLYEHLPTTPPTLQ